MPGFWARNPLRGGRLEIVRDLENVKLHPATVDGRTQIQWSDEGSDVVSLDVHGDPHDHIELYTRSPAAATLVKRWAVNYNVDNPPFSTHGFGLIVEGQSTAENASGDDPTIRLQGTKSSSVKTDVRMADNLLEVVDVDTGAAVRLRLDVDSGELTVFQKLIVQSFLDLQNQAGAGFLQLREQSSPPAGVANIARLFAEDDGGGKTRLMVQFGTGAAQQVAIEP